MTSTIYSPNIVKHYTKENTKTKIFSTNNTETNYLSFNIIIFVSFLVLIGMYLSYKYKEKQNKNNNSNNNNCYIELIVSIFVILFLIIYFIFFNQKN